MKHMKITEAWDNKDIIIANCKESNASKGELKRLIITTTKEEFEEVLCNNFHWCVENNILTEWLPEILYCKILNCIGCKNLKSLPELPNCITLICIRCTGLTSLPKLPNCTGLYCEERLKDK